MKSAVKLSRLMPPLAESNPIRHHRSNNTPSQPRQLWGVERHRTSAQPPGDARYKSSLKNSISGFAKILWVSPLELNRDPLWLSQTLQICHHFLLCSMAGQEVSTADNSISSSLQLLSSPASPLLPFARSTSPD